MLLSIGTKARREAARDQLQQLVESADWTRLTSILQGERLLCTLGPRIVEIAGQAASDEFRETLAATLDSCRHQDALLQMISVRLIEALGEAGIRSSSLKGPLVGELIYGEPGRRQSADIDLLVAPEDLGHATEIVRGLGYEEPVDHTEAGGLPLLHFSLLHLRGELPPVELHWRIHWYEARFARDRLLAPSPESPPDWRPDPVDELAALLLYYARDGFTSLRHATDLGAWWDRFGAELEGDALEQTAYPELQPTLIAAAEVASIAVGSPPVRDARALEDVGRRGRLAVRLASRPHRYKSREQLLAEIGLIDGLLTPRGGLQAFVRRQLAPPREVILEHAHKARSARSVSTAGYCVRMLARYGLALIRLLRKGGSAYGVQQV